MSKLDDLSDSIGEFIKYWGFKPIHGKIWTYVYLVERPVSSKELKTFFKISKALLSTTLSDLKEYEVILERGTGKHGAELFIANPDVFNAITKVLKLREKKLISNITSQMASINKLNKKELIQIEISPERLKNLNMLVKSGSKAIESVIKLEKINFSLWKNFKK
jgi:DNA-binding transcriptional regulator GbsR (MarR family)